MRDFLRQNRTSIFVGVFSSLVAMIIYVALEKITESFNGLNFTLFQRVLVFGVVLSIVVTILVFVLLSFRPRIWSNRDYVRPILRDRIRNATDEIIFVGVALDTTIQNNRQELCKVLNGDSKVKLKLLMLHPESAHVKGHEEFASWEVKNTIINTANGHIKGLFDLLDGSARRRFEAELTYYIPRFSMKLIDDSMLINFYLYKRSAHENPVIEFNKKSKSEDFINIYRSIENLFMVSSNHKLIKDGGWKGYP